MWNNILVGIDCFHKIDGYNFKVKVQTVDSFPCDGDINSTFIAEANGRAMCFASFPFDDNSPLNFKLKIAEATHKMEVWGSASGKHIYYTKDFQGEK